MKKKFNLLSLILLPFILTSCNNVTSFVPYEHFYNDSPFERIENDNYLKIDEYKGVSYLNNNNLVETIPSYKDSFESGDIEHCLSALGDIELLVIPVDFIDYKLDIDKETSIRNISNAFFGDPSTNKWESVASYYNKSSYGRLRINGKVSDWFTYEDKTYEELKDSSVSSKLVGDIKDKAVGWYKENYDDFDRFDKDKDGEIDALYLIYSCPPITTIEATSFFWAYVIYDKNPVAWSSYHLCYEDHGIVDSHTYIHETAHMFGLHDYYDVDGLINPLFHMDMMDYNIGDHTGYSKMLLDWVKPYNIKNETTLRIRPFSSSGDLILLKTNWNESPMDEYLLLEFYSPQGLNNNDSKHQLGGVSLFNQTGLKVYHVDSRLGFVERQNQRMVKGYVNETKLSKSNYLVKVINTNSNRSYQNSLLYQLLPRDKTPKTINDILLRQGDNFFELGYQDYALHDGGDIGFNFIITEMTNAYCEISFVKK